MAKLRSAVRPFQWRQAAPFAVMAVAVGVVVTAAILAAGTPVAFEAESGTLGGGAAVASLSGASGGSAVKFGAAATPTPTATPVSGPVNGMLTNDPNFFPIGVWLQTPESTAAQYKAIGINTFVGHYNGVSHANLQAMANNGFVTIADQNSASLSDSLAANVLKAWLPYDEPDNAQANDSGGYDPCIPASTVVSAANAMKAADPSHRPVMLGFGRGVADVNWVGRGTCTGNTQYYRDAAAGGDIFAFDIYPVNNDGGKLYLVAQGVDNLRTWTGGTKPVWADIETTAFSSGNGQPTPAQTKFEVWSAIIHGAKGIDYFCHIFSPSFIEAGLLSRADMSAAVKAINAQITSLAAVINVGTPVANTVTSSAGAGVPVDTMTKSYGGSTYVFAAAMRGAATTATYRPAGISSGTVTVLGENRTLTLTGGAFTDTFAGYDTHIYKID